MDADDADRLEQRTTVLGRADEDSPARARRSRVVVMVDPLVEVAVRVHADVAA